MQQTWKVAAGPWFPWMEKHSHQPTHVYKDKLYLLEDQDTYTLHDDNQERYMAWTYILTCVTHEDGEWGNIYSPKPESFDNPVPC